jgi:hypothetical protein
MKIPFKRPLSIWSFIAFIFIIYGLVITGAGIYYFFYLRPDVALSNLDPSLLWGLLLLLVGLIFNWIDLKTSKEQDT